MNLQRVKNEKYKIYKILDLKKCHKFNLMFVQRTIEGVDGGHKDTPSPPRLVYQLDPRLDPRFILKSTFEFIKGFAVKFTLRFILGFITFITNKHINKQTNMAYCAHHIDIYQQPRQAILAIFRSSGYLIETRMFVNLFQDLRWDSLQDLLQILLLETILCLCTILISANSRDSLFCVSADI